MIFEDCDCSDEADKTSQNLESTKYSCSRR